jgi:hypothetical protein
MLSAFASVARAFTLTLTDINQNKTPGGYKPNRSLEELRRTIGRLLPVAAAARHNVIIRPHSTTATLIQLDDLDIAKAERIAPYAFLVFRTSPNNYQAWIAAEKGAPEDFSRRLRKGTGADLTASGSTRIAGSLNFKAKYAPAFPMVEITHAKPGNFTTTTALEWAGFVAAPEQPRPPQRTREPSSGGRNWPSYDRCVQGAPPAQGDPERFDISRADFTWCRTAYQWGWPVEAIAARLTELSSAAKKDGPRYVQLTVTRAAASVDRDPWIGIRG